MDLVRRVVELGWRVNIGLRWASVLLWAGMIFVLSNQPGLAVSDDRGVDLPLRHAAHVVVYAVLTMLLGWALAGPRMPSRRILVVAGALALLYGITDEWHQTFVPSRSGQPVDLIWDGIGVLIGGTLLWAIARTADPGPSRPT